ncbi:Capsular polysaccharide biosynthesis protein [Mycobacteroides abscessus subsp. abscessus]|nr:Capsular polysaccharide biosynthesis protein [Mycobacteroides abscessus subsp. abscessus]
MANSPLVLDAAAKQLDPSGDMTGGLLKQGLTVGWPSNSLVLTFAVKADSSQEAIRRVTTIANTFVETVPQATEATGGVALGAKVIYLHRNCWPSRWWEPSPWASWSPSPST